MRECEACGGRGWTITADGGAGTARRCACRLGPRPLSQRLAQAGVWELYRECSPATWCGEPDPWPARPLRDFGRRSSLVTICGRRGSGKTHLATAILAAHLERGGQGLWREISSTLAAVKDAMSDGRSAALLAELLDPRLLVLDAYGSHQATAWADAEVARIVRYRHGRDLPTVLTVDLPSLLELDEIDPGLSSRCGGGIVIVLRGADRRLARGAA